MIPDNTCILRLTAAAGTELADAYSSGNVIFFLPEKRGLQPIGRHPSRGIAPSGFRHCGKFPTAASRRSLDRVSVPVCLIILSNQILIVALVSHYLTNKLISRKLLSRRKNPFHSKAYGVLATVSSCYPPPKGKFLRVTHPSAT